MKVSYSERPLEIELMPEGHTKFRFDIEELTQDDKTQFTCSEVDIMGAPTSDKVIAAAINEKWGNGVEQKLINDFNEYQINDQPIEAKMAYIDFLEQRRLLKQYVKSIINEEI